MHVIASTWLSSDRDLSWPRSETSGAAVIINSLRRTQMDMDRCQVLLMGRICKTVVEVFASIGCLSDLPFRSRVHTTVYQLDSLTEYEDPKV